MGVAARPGEPPDGFDVLLTEDPDAPRPWVACADPQVTARRIAGAVERHPTASVALVQVLRTGSTLAPPDRLVVESLAYSALQGGADFRAWLAAAPPRRPRPAARPVRLRRDGDRLDVVLDARGHATPSTRPPATPSLKPWRSPWPT